MGMLSWIQILTLTSMLRHSCTSRFMTACARGARVMLDCRLGWSGGHAPRVCGAIEHRAVAGAVIREGGRCRLEGREGVEARWVIAKIWRIANLLADDSLVA